MFESRYPKPITVYRIEHIVSGQGIYRHDGSTPKLDPNIGVITKSDIFKHNTSSYPTINEEEWDNYGYADYLKHNKAVCGCISLTQLFHWFSKQTICNAYNSSFKVYAYYNVKYYVKGEHQVLFDNKDLIRSPIDLKDLDKLLRYERKEKQDEMEN